MLDYRISGKKRTIKHLAVTNDNVAGSYSSCGAKPFERLRYGACVGRRVLLAPLFGDWTTGIETRMEPHARCRVG
jgi:hypothetical protein